MYYDLLNLPSTSPERADTLKKIVQHVLPDTFLVNELDNDFVNSFNFNSTSRELELFLKKNAGKLMLTVYDISGKRIRTQTYSESEQIKTSFPYLRSGIYIINLQTGGMNTSLKVVVL